MFTGILDVQYCDVQSLNRLTLGTPDFSSRIATTAVTAKNMTWTPKAGSTDLAGNALGSTATWTETDTDRDF